MTELPPRRRRERPPFFEWTVFAVAAFLALFLAYEVAKRRVKPAPPAPAASAYQPAGPTASAAAPPSVTDPPEPAATGASAPFRTERRVTRKKTDVPAPRP